MRPALDFAIALDIREPFLQASLYFSLIVPVCGVLLGLALVACWTVLRQHRYLLWLAAAYILPAVPLAAQTLMSNEHLARTAVLLGAFYLSGLWAMAQGMALKYGGAAHPRLAAVVGVLALGLLYYFSQVTDQLRIRILVLNLAMVLLLLLGVMAVCRQRRPVHGLERLLRASYLVFVAYSVLRPAIVAVFLWEGPLPELSSSPLWLLMLAVNLLLSLWFIAVLLAVSVREMFVILKHERDRDALTQLLNRRAFFEQAPSRMRQPGPWHGRRGAEAGGTGAGAPCAPGRSGGALRGRGVCADAALHGPGGRGGGGAAHARAAGPGVAAPAAPAVDRQLRGGDVRCHGFAADAAAACGYPVVRGQAGRAQPRGQQHGGAVARHCGTGRGAGLNHRALWWPSMSPKWLQPRCSER